MWWRADASVARRIQPTFGSRTPHVTNIYQNRSPWTCMKIALVSLCSIPHTVSSPSVQCTATQHIPTDANGAHETGSKVTFDTTGVANIGVPRVPHLPNRLRSGSLQRGGVQPSTVWNPWQALCLVTRWLRAHPGALTSHLPPRRRSLRRESSRSGGPQIMKKTFLLFGVWVSDPYQSLGAQLANWRMLVTVHRTRFGCPYNAPNGGCSEELTSS